MIKRGTARRLGLRRNVQLVRVDLGGVVVIGEPRLFWHVGHPPLVDIPDVRRTLSQVRL